MKNKIIRPSTKTKARYNLLYAFLLCAHSWVVDAIAIYTA